MKLSIAWMFDHIASDWNTKDIPNLVNLFNQKTAEVEAYYPIHLDIENLFLGNIVSVAQETMELEIPETGSVIELPNYGEHQIGQLFLLKRMGTAWRKATGKDFYNDNLGELPPVYCKKVDFAGGWKQHIDVHDFILEVDNKSITHRPDLWCHRGFAREVALLLQESLLPLEQMLANGAIQEFAQESVPDADQPFAVRIEQPHFIKRFAITYFKHIHHRPSLPHMVSRLCRVDSRPIDALVDSTNYVMFDVGQPLHAFDARKIGSHVLVPRLANNGERITLLDGDTIELTKDDLVISNGSEALALAGIMGAQDSAVSSQTESMVLEAANFDATTIRKMAMRHKKRTESAARFEKTLDPNLNTIGIQRFIKIIDDAEIPYTVSTITSVGPQTKPIDIVITHAYIEERLGISIHELTVKSILEALGCVVHVEHNEGQLLYRVTVPTLRSTKDVQHAEDLLEEIGRIYGYTHIPFSLPQKSTKPSDLALFYRKRHIKRMCSFGFQMREVKNYAFYNTLFLQELAWRPAHALSIQNPVSEQYALLVTSLIPGLLANVQENHVAHDQLRFFEWGRIWYKDTHSINERSELAGICYDKRKEVSFYTIKSYIEHVCAMLHIPVTWHTASHIEEPWFTPYRTAHIKHEDVVIGTVGVIDVEFAQKLFPGYAAAWSLNMTLLDQIAVQHRAYHPLSKYPVIERDISMIIPRQVTVAQIQQAILSCSSLITRVALIDYFEKPEWEHVKSLAFRWTMQDDRATLTHQQADDMSNKVVEAVRLLGAEVR